MNKLIMMIGIPGSGKSTMAKEIAKKENALIISSDSIREELFNDEDNQDNNGLVFEEVYKRARATLLTGQNVVLDATNISSRRRKGVLMQFNKYYKECYFINADLEKTLLRNSKRERVVPEEAIRKMYKTLHIPMYWEGWDKINVVNEYSEVEQELQNYSKEDLEDKILNGVGHDELFKILSNISREKNTIKGIFNLSQDTSYHTFSVSRHIYYVYKYILENHGEGKELSLLWSAILHDIGKGICKNFKDESRYANFIGHENVSAQIGLKVLIELGYDLEFALKVAELIQLHMRISWESEEKANDKFKSVVGEQVFNNLKVLREADTSAK